MKSSVFLVFLFLAAALGADPQSSVGKASGPVVAVVSGTEGWVRLYHGAALVREERVLGAFTAAVILDGPQDKVLWDGALVDVKAAGKDPVAVARQTLEGRSSDHLFLLKADGSVEVLKAPEAEEGESDGETAATAEE